MQKESYKKIPFLLSEVLLYQINNIGTREGIVEGNFSEQGCIFTAISFGSFNSFHYLCAIKSKTMHIAVAGNIGSGKSTLTELLAKHYGWEARFEAVDHNPYLEDYYRDIYRWSFNLEVYFLKERFRDLIDIAKADHTVIQDRTIYEGVYVFMENNKAMGHLSDRDYETFMELFNQMMTVEKDQLDYLNNPKDLAQIIDRIDSNLFGLFSDNG